MSSALTGLNQIPGVIGSVIFNQDDECIAHLMPPQYDAEILAQVMAELRNALEVLAYLDENATWNAIVLRFHDGYLVMRQIQKLTVLVLAQPTLNPAMLSVGFNVAALKLEKEVLPPSALPPPPAPPAPPPLQTTAPAVRAPTQQPSGRTTQPVAPLGQSYDGQSPPAGSLGSTRDFAISQSGSIPGITPRSGTNPRFATASQARADSRDGSLGSSTADAVGRTIVEALLVALARHIGPFAKLIVKEELSRLGVTAATLGVAQYDDFVTLLSRRVQDPSKRREFMAEAEALPSRR